VALHVHEITDGDDDLLDLLSQFAGWCEDEGLASLQGRVDFLQDRDREGSRLSGTGLSLSDNVMA
jgi:hypothetical protein